MSIRHTEWPVTVKPIDKLSSVRPTAWLMTQTLTIATAVFTQPDL